MSGNLELSFVEAPAVNQELWVETQRWGDGWITSQPIRVSEPGEYQVIIDGKHSRFSLVRTK